MSKRKKKGGWRKRYFFEIITLAESENIHTYARSNDLHLTYKDRDDKNKEIEVEISPKDLYEREQFFVWHFLIWIFTGIHKHYYVILDKDGNSIRPSDPKVSAVILKDSRDWKGLNPAFADMFKGRFGDIKGNAVFIIGAVFIIIVVWLVYTGRINIGGWKFR